MQSQYDDGLNAEISNLIATKEGPVFMQKAWAALFKFGPGALNFKVALRNFIGHSDIADYSKPPYLISEERPPSP